MSRSLDIHSPVKSKHHFSSHFTNGIGYAEFNQCTNGEFNQYKNWRPKREQFEKEFAIDSHQMVRRLGAASPL